MSAHSPDEFETDPRALTGTDDDEIVTVLEGEEPTQAETVDFSDSFGQGFPRQAIHATGTMLTSDSGDYPSPEDRTGQWIGRFEVLGEIGRGGMGQVFRAQDPDLRRSVALKTMLRGDQPQEERQRRFIAEAQVTGQLEHPGIVPVHEIGRSGGEVYFVMKEIEGRSLEEVLRDLRAEDPEVQERWSRGRLLRAYVQVCHAVAYAHSRGVIHRDIKPANIMLGRFGEVLLVDWGVARTESEVTQEFRRDSVQRLTMKLTLDGAVVGTPGYMAPEQAKGQLNQVDECSDVWSLGAVLYELLTYEPVYKGRNAFIVLLATTSDPPEDPRQKAPQRQVPDELAEASLKAMSLEKEDRFQTVLELAQAVEAFLEGRKQHEHALTTAAQAARKSEAADDLREQALELWHEVESQLQSGGSTSDSWKRWKVLLSLRQRAEVLDYDSEDTWRAALVHDPRLPEAHRALASRRAQEWGRTLATKDSTALERSRRLLQAHLDLLPPEDSLRHRLEGQLAGRERQSGFTHDARGQFVGRRAELTAMGTAWASGTRLVTLVGAAGVGKTRLSLEHGLSRWPNNPGGVWFVDLSEARSVLGIVDAVALALGVPLTQTDLVGQVGWALAGRGPVLLVMDNFEQVVKYAELTVERWLQVAPQLKIIVTSRTKLGISGESLVSVGPMGILASIELFVARARAQRPTFHLTENSWVLVLNIVQRLDCMPLAIELAAARVGMLTISELSDRLAQRFDLLRSRLRDEEQRTLEGAIDWSWQLLLPASRVALAQCSIFQGGFDLPAAEAVLDLSSCPSAPPILDVVEALCDDHLLRQNEAPDSPTRYSLFESIRAFSAKKIQEDPGLNAEALSGRHASYYAGFGEEEYLEGLHTHGGGRRRRLLALERENLIAGVEAGMATENSALASGCALGVWELFWTAGPFFQGSELLGRILSIKGLDPVQRMRLLSGRGRLLFMGNRSDDALDHYESAMALAQELGNERHEAICRGEIGMLLQKEGRFDEARASYGLALTAARELGDRRHECLWRGHLGELGRYQGDMVAAEKDFDTALELARELGDRQYEGIWLGELSKMYRQLGRVLEALEYTEAALAVAKELNDRRSEGNWRGNLGIVQKEQGRIPEALASYEAALAISRELGGRRNEGVHLGNLAILLKEAKEVEQARVHYEMALTLAQELGDRRSEGIHLGNLGDLLLQSEDWSAATERFEQAIAIGDKTWPVAAGAFRGSLALLRLRDDRVSEARALLARGEEQLRNAHSLELGKLLCKRVQVEHASGQDAAAHAALSEAESIASETDTRSDSELGQAIYSAHQLLGGVFKEEGP